MAPEPGGSSSGATARRAAAAVLQRPPNPAALHDSAAVLLSDQAAQLIVALAGVVMLYNSWGRAAPGTPLFAQLHPTLVVLSYLAGWLFMVWRSKVYLCNRTWLLPTIRVASCLWPSTRAVKLGLALVLERPAQPGLKGALLDGLRVLTGTRVLPFGLQTAFQMLPPTATLLMQAALTALTWNLDGYCSSVLLWDPLSQQRQAVVAATMELVSLPAVAAMPVAGHILPATAALSGEARAEAVCRSTMAFCHVLLGLLLPMAASAYMWRPPPIEPHSAAPAPAAGLGSRARSAAAACDHALAWLFGRHGGWAVRALVLLYMSAVAWQACSIHAGLGRLGDGRSGG